MATITYDIDRPVLSEQVAELYDSAGLNRPTGDLKRIQRMMAHADLTISAWDGETLVGLARAVTDWSYCCYLSDLAVRREYQHGGVGRQLVHRVQEEIGEEVMLLLLSAPEAMDYYPKVGFTKVENGWIIPRRR